LDRERDAGPTVLVDVVEQELEVSKIRAKDNIEQRSNDGNCTNQGVDQEVHNHAERQPVICAETACAHN